MNHADGENALCPKCWATFDEHYDVGFRDGMAEDQAEILRLRDEVEWLRAAVEDFWDVYEPTLIHRLQPATVEVARAVHQQIWHSVAVPTEPAGETR